MPRHYFRPQYQDANLSESMKGRHDRRVYVPVSKGSRQWIPIDEVQFGFPDVHDHTGYKTIVSQTVCQPQSFQTPAGMNPAFLNTTFGIIHKDTSGARAKGVNQYGAGALNDFSHPNGLGVQFGKLPSHPRWAPGHPIEMGMAGHGKDSLGKL